MFEPPSKAETLASGMTIRPAIFLDYGLDGASGEDAACEICERGMRFQSRWQFEMGTILSIAFSFEENAPGKVKAEGMVIDCTPAGDGEHLTTLAFLEPSPNFRSSLGEVSNRLDSFHSRRHRTRMKAETL